MKRTGHWHIETKQWALDSNDDLKEVSSHVGVVADGPVEAIEKVFGDEAYSPEIESITVTWHGEAGPKPS